MITYYISYRYTGGDGKSYAVGSVVALTQPITTITDVVALTANLITDGFADAVLLGFAPLPGTETEPTP